MQLDREPLSTLALFRIFLEVGATTFGGLGPSLAMTHALVLDACYFDPLPPWAADAQGFIRRAAAEMASATGIRSSEKKTCNQESSPVHLLASTASFHFPVFRSARSSRPNRLYLRPALEPMKRTLRRAFRHERIRWRPDRGSGRSPEVTLLLATEFGGRIRQTRIIGSWAEMGERPAAAASWGGCNPPSSLSLWWVAPTLHSRSSPILAHEPSFFQKSGTAPSRPRTFDRIGRACRSPLERRTCVSRSSPWGPRSAFI